MPARKKAVSTQKAHLTKQEIEERRDGYHSNTWNGCIKCHHRSIDWKFHDSGVCGQSIICSYKVYRWKIK